MFKNQSIKNSCGLRLEPLKKNDEPYLPLFIFDRQTNYFIGSTGFNHYDWSVPCVEIGYWIRSSCAGNGFITEAVNALTQYAFKQLKVNRVAITCAINNIPSQKIATRLGYVLEGKLRQNCRTVSGDLSAHLFLLGTIY